MAGVRLHQHDAPLDDVGFSELRPGLDHVAFKCADQDELEAWRQRLVELGIEHSEVLHEFYGSGLAFRDPDGIALEFFSPPPRRVVIEVNVISGRPARGT